MARFSSASRRGVHNVRGKRSGRALTDLPAGIIGESTDLHAMRGATRSWSAVAVVVVPAAAASAATTTALFAMARAAGELDSQAFSHEVGSIFTCRC